MASQTLVFPLRSNARSLVRGAPVASVRRKLKTASLLYENVILESGVLRLSSGPQGSFSVVEYRPPGDTPDWETAVARRQAQQHPFSLAMGREDVPGVPAQIMTTVFQTDSTIAWMATFEPFAWEMPAMVDWIGFGHAPRLPTELDRLAKDWTRADERSEVLKRAVPEQRTRAVLIANANHDLAMVVAAGHAAAVDPWHAQVVNRRLEDDVSWHGEGYAVPIALPQVGALDWEDIRNVRKNKEISRFRDMMSDIEAEVAQRAANEGLETAVRRVYGRELAKAVGDVEGVAAPFGRAVQVVAFGVAGGLATMGIVGLGGLSAGAGIGAAVGGVFDVRKVLKRRRSSGWATISQQITGG
jgi:hypothetical protein